jgi:hypothetical protein
LETGYQVFAKILGLEFTFDKLWEFMSAKFLKRLLFALVVEVAIEE